ncbi:hypothetical protein HDV57DRAFT_16946 [Trichoderma longibrachiatum]
MESCKHASSTCICCAFAFGLILGKMPGLIAALPYPAVKGWVSRREVHETGHGGVFYLRFLGVQHVPGVVGKSNRGLFKSTPTSLSLPRSVAPLIL